MRLTNVRLAFPVLFEAKTVNGEGKPAFSAAFLMDAADPQVEAINAEIERVATEKWGAKAPAMLKTLRATDKVALHDGDLKSQYDGYAGNLYISARNKVRPQILDRDAKTELTESDGKVYAGCYVNAIVDFWAQDNNYGKRINATFYKVQFFQDGDAFAGGGMSDEEFDDLAVGAEAEGLV
jgi:hypothetical protein